MSASAFLRGGPRAYRDCAFESVAIWLARAIRCPAGWTAPLLTVNASGQTRVHGKPKPLSAGAVTHDWPAFLGPSHNAVSTETKLSRTLPPPLVWEFTKGTGYASPAIAGERLVFLHRLGDEEIVECLHPETGASHWQFRYPTEFEDRYGYNNGPRSSPVIDGARVYTVGAEGQLHCLDLESGQRDLEARSADRVPSAAGFFRDGVDAAGGRPAADRQRRRAGRSVRRRARQDDGARSVAGRHESGDRATRRRFRRWCTASGACSCLPEASPIRRPAG